MTEITRDFADHTYRLLRGLQQPKDTHPKPSVHVVPPARHYARIPWWTFRTPVYDDVYVFFGKRMEDKATGFSPDPIETEDSEKCWSQDEEYDDPSKRRRNILDEDITLTFEVELDSDDDEDDFKSKVSNKDPTFKVDIRVIKKQNQPSGMTLKQESADYYTEAQNNDKVKMSAENADHSVVYKTENIMSDKKDEHDAEYTDKDITSENDVHGVVYTDKDETPEKNSQEDENNMADENSEHDIVYNDEDVMEMFERKRDHDLINKDEDSLFEKNGDHDVVYKNEDEKSDRNGAHSVVYTDDDRMSDRNGVNSVVYTDDDRMSDRNGAHSVIYTDDDRMPDKKDEYNFVYTDKDEIFEKNDEHDVKYTIDDKDKIFEKNDEHDVKYTTDDIDEIFEKTGKHDVKYTIDDKDEIFEKNDEPGVRNTEEENHLTFNGQDNSTDLPACSLNTNVVQNETDKETLDHDDNDMEGLMGIYARGQYDLICLNDKVNIDTYIEDYCDEMQGVLGLYASD